MIVKLPINFNDKIIYEKFDIIMKDNEIIVEAKSNKNYLNVIYNDNYGINNYNIYFPLRFIIYKKYLLNEYFFINKLLYHNNNLNLNFFYLLENYINKISKNKLSFIPLEKLDINYINEIINIINKNCTYITKISDQITIDELYLNIYNKYQFYVNISLSIIYSNKIEKIKPSKRIKNCILQLNQIKIFFYGQDVTLDTHLKNINNNIIKKDILLDQKMFIENKKSRKILNLFVIKIENNTIFLNNKTLNLDLYNVYFYNNNFKNCISLSNLFKIFIKNNKIINNIFNVLFKNEYNELCKFFKTCNYDHIITSNIFELPQKNYNYSNLENNTIYSEDISFNKFKNIIDSKKFSIDILNNLLKNYNYPLNYLKTDLSITFKKILYIFIIFNKNIVNLNYNEIFNFKYKNIFIFSLNFINGFNKNKMDIINNSKIYTESLYFSITFILLFNNELLEENSFLIKIRNLFLINIKLTQVVKSVDWENIKFNIYKIKFLIENKHNKLIFIDKKINKNIYYNFNNNIQKLINNPFTICSYLKLKNDFIKWTNIFYEYINYIFINTVKVKKTDLSQISKILYLISKIEKQDLNDEEYVTIIKSLAKIKDLILYNDRININIKELFSDKNINLGYLLKHILIYQDDTITLSDNDIDTDGILKEKYQNTRKKYYKYKGKYLDLKSSELSTNATHSK